MTAWIVWALSNWQLIALLALVLGSLTFYFDRHPDEAERFADRLYR